MTPLVSALVDAVVYLLGRACRERLFRVKQLRCPPKCKACELRERLEREAT